MSNQGPQVSVFHFTSKISKAKIEKYRIATQRGMNPPPPAGPSVANPSPVGATPSITSVSGTTLSNDDKRSGRVLPNLNQTVSATPASSADTRPSPSGRASVSSKKRKSNAADQPLTESLSKKPKIKLRGPKPIENPSESIAVSRPKRESALRAQYWREIEFVDESPAEEESVIQTGTLKSETLPTPSSGLSELSSAAPSSKEASPAPRPPADPSAGEDYGDFSMYYIDAVDEELIKKPKTKRKSASNLSARLKTGESKPLMPVSSNANDIKQGGMDPSKETALKDSVQAAQSIPATASTAPPLPPQKKRRQQPQSQHDAASSLPAHQNQAPLPQHQVPIQAPLAPQQRPLQPHPLIRFNKIAMEPKPTKPDSISGMIKKLERLSRALADFGNVRGPPASPIVTKSKRVVSPGSKVDAFLSHFDGESDDGLDENYLDRDFSNAGSADDALSYGIAFIQNALESWAKSRLASEAMQQFAMDIQQFPNASGKASRFEHILTVENGQEWLTLDLASTPECMAIRSFQEILDSGCLRLNVRLPIELSRALRNLYVQIDHLINQGQKRTTDWQCMSYGAQIQAHEARIRKTMEAQAMAHAEMARQQQLVEHHMMFQMGLSRHSSGTNVVRGYQPHGNEIGRRRSAPQSIQHHSHNRAHNQDVHVPDQLGSSMILDQGGLRRTSSKGFVPASMAVQQDTRRRGSITNGGSRKSGLHQSAGPSYKFSFAPTSEEAVKAFGVQAFPSTSTRRTSSNAQADSLNGATHIIKPARPGDSSTSPMEIFSSDAASPAPANYSLASDVDASSVALRGVSGRSKSSQAAFNPSRANGMRSEKSKSRPRTSAGSSGTAAAADSTPGNKSVGAPQPSSRGGNLGFTAINAASRQIEKCSQPVKILSSSTASSQADNIEVIKARPVSASPLNGKTKIRLIRRKANGAQESQD